MIRLPVLPVLSLAILSLLLGSCTLPESGPNVTLYNGPETAAPGAAGFRTGPPPPSGSIFSSPSNVSPQAPPINASSYILVNARSGQVLAARGADDPRQVASTQKLLTALVVAESGNLDAPLRIAYDDVCVAPTKLGVRPGDVYTRRDLLVAFLVKSCNDVAAALGRDNAGSIAAFAERMNERARQAGATNSYFVNPHGLTAAGQHSTARDMARIALAAHRNPVIQDAVRRKYYSFTYANGRSVTLENTNELLGVMPECDGMKTGYTEPAGRCLVSSARSWGHEVILVQLGSRTKYIFNDGARMMHWGLER